MCSVYRLNKQGDSREPVILLSQSSTNQLFHRGSNCCFLIHIQVSQETGKMIWYFHLLRAFHSLIMIHTVKGFSTVNETEVDAFLDFRCLPYDPVNVGNLISGSSAFSKPNMDIWKFSVHIMLKPGMQDFKHDLTSLGDECNCLMVRTFFSTTLLGKQNEDWPFPVLWPLLGLPDLLTYWMQHVDVIIL